MIFGELHWVSKPGERAGENGERIFTRLVEIASQGQNWREGNTWEEKHRSPLRETYPE